MMNRRRFLTQSSLAAGAYITGANRLQPRDPVILGHGAYRYKVKTDWGAQDPAQYPVKDCHEMGMDKKGRIFMGTNHTHNNVLIYNKDGKITGAWGTEYPGMHGLTLHDENGEEFLYLTDYERNEVIKTTLEGRVVRVFSYPADSGKYSAKQDYKPTETTIAPNGDVYVADGYGKDFIVRYNQEGHLTGIWGGHGGGPEELNNAHGIALDTRNPAEPALLVTSRANNTLKRFSLDGKLLQSYPLPGAYICRPVIKGKNVYFAVLISRLPWDSQSGFVMILDENNQVVSCPGGSPPHYDKEQHLDTLYQTVRVFKHPHDVLVDEDDNIYVAQWNSGQVYPFKLERV